MPSPFFHFPRDTGPRPIIKYVGWVLAIVKFIAGRRRFCPLTPPSCRTQRLLVRGRDGRTSIQTFHLRDFSDHATFEQIFLAEIYNLGALPRIDELRRHLDQLATDGKVGLIVDCGANIGASSSYFADEFPTCLVLGLEPEPMNFRQAQLNRFQTNVVPINAGIGSSDRSARVEGRLGLNNGFTVEYDDGGAVTIVSMDTLLRGPHVDPAIHVPFLVKIDIEGFEDDLFSANVAWVDRFPILIIELHDWLYQERLTSRNFLRLMARLDRDFLVSGESVISVKNHLHG